MIPSLVYPVEVISEENEVTTINGREEFLELRRSCGKSFYGSRGRHWANGDHCFDLVFPVTVILPDERTITAQDRDDLRAQLRAWMDDNGGVRGDRPRLQFPVTIELEDRTRHVVGSQEELSALKDTCNN